jgi:hypothetical protein
MLLMDHLPECPAPLCDWDDPKGKCMGYEYCEHLCCCAAIRACEQRVLDAAREAIAEQKLVPLAKQGRFIITRNTKLWEKRQAWSELGWWDFRTSALAAIEALGGSNGN